MTTAYCIDVSGSMSDEDKEKAFKFVSKGIEPGDSVILFDIYAVLVDSKELSSANVVSNNRLFSIGRGGTDASNCLKLAKEVGAYRTVLISDGYLVEEQILLFNKFIDIETLK
jgi:hypothetical protein